ncbi:hypothetical protein OAO94_05945 [Flavobacteriaceae bacterium]|nr:hypothetical protein [Flavobacteriaceae bacterium]
MVSNWNVKRNILLLDSFNELDSHIEFNSNFIRTVLESEPNVDLAMHTGHYNRLNINLNRAKLVYAKFNENNSIIKQVLNGIKIARVTSKYQRVIILSLERYSFLSLLVFSFLRGLSRPKIVIVHHAWLSQLKYSKLIKFAVKRSLGKFRNIVLGKWIMETLYRFGIDDSELIPHPIAVRLKSPKKTNKGNSYRIAYLGNAHQNKGFDVFARLASSLRDNVKREFFVIGKRGDYVTDCERANNIQFNCVEVASGNDFLSEIAKCDLVVFPFPVDRYELYCSGVVFDCISQEIPFVFLKGNVMLNHLHTKFNLGERMDDFESLCCFIENLNSTALAELNEQYSNRDLLFELNGFAHNIKKIFNA